MTTDGTRPVAAISTILHVANYGSVLQAYATKKLLTDRGFDVTFVDYVRPDVVDPVRSAAQRSSLAKGPILELAFRIAIGKFTRRRGRIFEEFIHERLPLTRPYASIDELSAEPPHADLYVVGSDQVWNSDYNEGGTAPFLLEFVPQGAPKVALSSSIGKEVLSEGDRIELRGPLASFQWISVRESSAKSLLSEIGIKSDQILDPTLLVDRRVWSEMAQPPQRSGGYVFVYNLFPRNGFREAAAPVLHNSREPVVVAQSAPFVSVAKGAQKVLPTPEEFLGWLRGATRVVTDSFHGTALCLSMGVPVSVVMPRRYSTRITDLLGLLDLSDLIVGNGERGGLTDLSASRWEMVHRTLENTRAEQLGMMDRELMRVMRAR